MVFLLPFRHQDFVMASSAKPIEKQADDTKEMVTAQGTTQQILMGLKPAGEAIAKDGKKKKGRRGKKKATGFEGQFPL